jgi:hypothetical protein
MEEEPSLQWSRAIHKMKELDSVLTVVGTGSVPHQREDL